MFLNFVTSQEIYKNLLQLEVHCSIIIWLTHRSLGFSGKDPKAIFADIIESRHREESFYGWRQVRGKREVRRAEGKDLLPTYATGTDKDSYQWRTNINAVNIGEASEPVKRYLTSAERYFYSQDWFGSEKRKNPA